MQLKTAFQHLHLDRQPDQPADPDGYVVLRDGDTMAVIAANGDIDGAGLQSLEGLYQDETRHLSRTRLLINGVIPEVVAADLDPSETVATIALRQGALAITRRLVILDQAMHEEISITNTAETEQDCTIMYEQQADFENSFAVRGGEDALRQPGEETLVTTIHNGIMRFDSSGIIDPLDWQAVYPLNTQLVFTAADHPFALASTGAAEGLAVWQAMLAPAQTITVGRQAYCGTEKKAIFTPLAYAVAEATALNKRQARQQAFTGIAVPGQVGAFFQAAQRDSNFLLTETPLGLYPYAGTPVFNRIFGRDGIITALLCEMISPAIMKGVIRNLAARQARTDDPSRDAEPGKIAHECSLDRLSNVGRLIYGDYYGSADSTPLFLIACGVLLNHLTVEEARVFFTPLLPAIDAAARWCEAQSGPDGLIWFAPREEGGFAIQSWMDSDDSIFHEDGALADPPIAVLEVQAYLYASDLARAAIYDRLGKSAEAAPLVMKAAALRMLIDEKFWDDQLATYVPAIDRHGPCRVRKSSPGHMLWAGAAEERRVAPIVAQLLSPDMFSGWGIRTNTTNASRYNPNSYHNGSVWPHDNAMCAIGMARYGYKAEAAEVLRGMFDAFCATGELPELIQGLPRIAGQPPLPYFNENAIHVGANKQQAWAAAAPIGILQALAGLVFDTPGNRLIVNRPYLPDFFDGELMLKGLRVGGNRIDLQLTGVGYKVELAVLSNPGGVIIDQPAGV